MLIWASHFIYRIKKKRTNTDTNISLKGTEPEGNKVQRWFIAFVIILAASTAIITAVTYYVSQPGEQYFLVIQHQWTTPPMTTTTAPFTITGRQWYVDWSYASYSLLPFSMDVSVRNASNDVIVERVTLTNQQPIAYFSAPGDFYLSIILKNTTNAEQQSVLLVSIWELR